MQGANVRLIISGGTSTGKTTILNTLVNYIPLNERIITIESDREVTLNHKNCVHLLASQDAEGVSEIDMLDLLKATLRLRPDRILVSEIRANEAFSYLRAINSGHPGSITTLHADSPEGCIEQLIFMAIQSGINLSRIELYNYIKSVVNIIIQVKKNHQGERYISEVYYAKAEKKINVNIYS